MPPKAPFMKFKEKGMKGHLLAAARKAAEEEVSAGASHVLSGAALARASARTRAARANAERKGDREMALHRSRRAAPPNQAEAEHVAAQQAAAAHEAAREAVAEEVGAPRDATEEELTAALAQGTAMSKKEAKKIVKTALAKAEEQAYKKLSKVKNPETGLVLYGRPMKPPTAEAVAKRDARENKRLADRNVKYEELRMAVTSREALKLAERIVKAQNPADFTKAYNDLKFAQSHRAMWNELAPTKEDKKLLTWVASQVRAAQLKVAKQDQRNMAVYEAKIDPRTSKSNYGYGWGPNGKRKAFAPDHPARLARYGARPSKATWEQTVNRATDGYTGHGDFFGDIFGGLKDVASAVLPAVAPVLLGAGSYFSDFAKSPLFKSLKNVATSAVKSAITEGAQSGFTKESLMRGAKKGARSAFKGHGSYLSARVPNMYGSGDYEVQPVIPKNIPGMTLNNAIVNPGSATSRKTQILSQGTTADGNLILRAREFLTDVIPGVPDSSGFFTLPLIRVNPGLQQSFPLAALKEGQFYTSYRMEQLLYEFESTIGLSNTAVAGTILMAPLYNVNDPPFSSKRGMERCNGIVTAGIQQNVVLGIECQRSSNLTTNLLIRTGELAPGRDLTLYDKCNVQIATSGVPSTIGSIGEVWVDYTIVFQDLRVYSLQPLALFDGAALSFAGANGVTSPLTATTLASAALGCNGTLPASGVQLDIIPSASVLQQQLGWIPQAQSNSPGETDTQLVQIDLNPVCVSTNIKNTSGVGATLTWQFEALAGQVFRVTWTLSVSRNPLQSDWTVPPSLTPIWIFNATGPVTAQFSLTDQFAGDGTAFFSDYWQLTATGNGGLVTVTIQPQNWDDPALPQAVLEQSTFSLTRVV